MTINYKRRNIYFRVETEKQLKKHTVRLHGLINDLLLFYFSHRSYMDGRLKQWKKGEKK